MSNIQLGTAVVDIPIFGEQTVQLTAIYLNCSLDMEVIGSYCKADIDGNGSVDVNDLLSVIAEWGCSCHARPTSPMMGLSMCRICLN